jgi:hypothetical protein
MGVSMLLILAVLSTNVCGFTVIGDIHVRRLPVMAARPLGSFRLQAEAGSQEPQALEETEAPEAEIETEDDSPRGFGKPRQKQEQQKNNKKKRKSAGDMVADQKIEGAINSSPRFTRMRDARERELDEKIRRLKEQDDEVALDPSVGAVPQVVADRMITRIATFFGVPVFGGLAIFVGAFLYSKKYDVVIPPAILAYATQAPFVLGLMGITYGILSSSWEDEPGSILGISEFKTNLERIQDGLKNTRDTAALRQEIEDEKRKLGRSDD